MNNSYAKWLKRHEIYIGYVAVIIPFLIAGYAAYRLLILTFP